MRMLHPTRNVFIGCLLFLTFAGTLKADPISIWTEPWSVSFTTFSSDPRGPQAASNFGVSATADQEKADLGTAGEMLPGTGVFARAKVATTCVFSVCDASAPTYSFQEVVSFNRRFALVNSPNGWDLSLTGFIAGVLGNVVSGVFSNPTTVGADGSFGLRIFQDVPFGILSPDIRLSYDANFTNFVSSSSISGNAVASIPDGSYMLAGSFSVKAQAGPVGILQTAGSISDFYSGSGGLTLTLNATPRNMPIPVPPPPPPPLLAFNDEILTSDTIPSVIPEPATWVLLATGFLGLVAVRWHRSYIHLLDRRKSRSIKVDRYQ